MEETLFPRSIIPEYISQPLLLQTNSYTLDGSLEALVNAARTETSRSQLATLNILPTLLELTKFLTNSSPHHHHLLLLSSLKALRNLCAGEIRNQNSFIAEKGVEIISGVLGFSSNSDYGVFRTALQLLGNVCLAGEKHQSVIWDRFFISEFMGIARIRRLEIFDPLCMVLYTCCNGSKVRLKELSGVQGLTLVAEIVNTASIVGFGEEWFKWLVSRICLEETHFPPLFYELSSDDATVTGYDGNSKDRVFTAEQVFLLSVVSESLNKQVSEIVVSNDFALCVLGILKKAIELVDLFSRGKSGLPTGVPEIDVLGYSVTILRDVCARSDPGSSKTEAINACDSLLSSGLLQLLLDVLHDLEPPEIIRKCISSEKNQVGSGVSGKLKVCPYKGFRRDIVGVIGNCVYRRKHAQDEIRDRNCILLLLQQCVTDDDNPYLREWGISSVRNLLEGNEQNQQEVAELKLQGSVDVPEISGLGLRVEVDQRTGRPKLVNVPKTETSLDQ